MSLKKWATTRTVKVTVATDFMAQNDLAEEINQVFYFWSEETRQQELIEYSFPC